MANEYSDNIDITVLNYHYCPQMPIQRAQISIAKLEYPSARVKEARMKRGMTLKAGPNHAS